jgi:hypothetical protein
VEGSLLDAYSQAIMVMSNELVPILSFKGIDNAS